jgi:hypothetical protein
MYVQKATILVQQDAKVQHRVTRLYSITSQKTAIFVCPTVRISDLIKVFAVLKLSVVTAL